MNLFSLFLLAFGLSMDAFAAAICSGLSAPALHPRLVFTTALWFGTFQAIMPILGAFLGSTFENTLSAIDHWIAFFLLSGIGITMLREAGNSDIDASVSNKAMFLTAVATSIDALAAGISLPTLNIPPLIAAPAIGLVTFLLSALGVIIGCRAGSRYQKTAERFGGFLLILLGIKVLLEHLF